MADPDPPLGTCDGFMHNDHSDPPHEKEASCRYWTPAPDPELSQFAKQFYDAHHAAPDPGPLYDDD